MDRHKKWFIITLLTLVLASIAGIVLAAPDAPEEPGAITASTLEKWVDPEGVTVKAGDVLTYTVRVELDPASINMGLYFVDPLSTGLVWGDFITRPGGFAWNSTLRAVVGPVDTSVSNPFTVSFTATVDPKGADIVNQAALCPEETNSIMLCPAHSDMVTTKLYAPAYLFLPLITHAYTSGTPANQSPYTPSNPAPADGVTGQSVDVDLSWTGGDPDGDSVTYAVYLEADDDSPDVEVTTGQTSTSYDPGTLAMDTHYYWQVVATDQHGASRTGPVWEFSTETSQPSDALLTPFDANVSDVVGPSSWSTNYGKTPEIIVASNGVALDVLAQDYDAETAWNAVLLHIEANATGYEATQTLTDIPMLDRIMGLANDAAGNRYYATGVDEDDVVDPYYPPLDTYRSNIVRVIKLDSAGNVLFNIDLDIARHAYNENAEMIINPMVAATARLAVGGNEIALVHGINTDPDWNISGRRHQKALSTRLDATTGDILRTSSVWVSHSFDQRLLYDGEGIIEHHLGDAYPRYIVFARNHTSYPLFHIKGDLGENNTRTRLGNVALIENDPDYDYIALFATEDSADTGDTINGPRNLAIVRVNGADNSIDPNLPDTLTVVSKGTEYTNRLRWLTHYSASSNLHAERPKLVGIGEDQYIVLWEQWLYTGDYWDTYNGVYGMVIDDAGNVLQEAKLLTDAHHLHRGDDAFFLDDRAAWMTGNATTQQLYLHFVDAALTYEMVTVE